MPMYSNHRFSCPWRPNSKTFLLSKEVSTPIVFQVIRISSANMLIRNWNIKRSFVCVSKYRQARPRLPELTQKWQPLPNEDHSAMTPRLCRRSWLLSTKERCLKRTWLFCSGSWRVSDTKRQKSKIDKKTQVTMRIALSLLSVMIKCTFPAKGRRERREGNWKWSFGRNQKNRKHHFCQSFTSNFPFSFSFPFPSFPFLFLFDFSLDTHSSA